MSSEDIVSSRVVVRGDEMIPILFKYIDKSSSGDALSVPYLAVKVGDSEWVDASIISEAVSEIIPGGGGSGN